MSLSGACPLSGSSLVRRMDVFLAGCVPAGRPGGRVQRLGTRGFRLEGLIDLCLVLFPCVFFAGCQPPFLMWGGDECQAGREEDRLALSQHSTDHAAGPVDRLMSLKEVTAQLAALSSFLYIFLLNL